MFVSDGGKCDVVAWMLEEMVKFYNQFDYVFQPILLSFVYRHRMIANKPYNV